MFVPHSKQMTTALASRARRNRSRRTHREPNLPSCQENRRFTSLRNLFTNQKGHHQFLQRSQTSPRRSQTNPRRNQTSLRRSQRRLSQSKAHQSTHRSKNFQFTTQRSKCQSTNLKKRSLLKDQLRNCRFISLRKLNR